MIAKRPTQFQDMIGQSKLLGEMKRRAAKCDFATGMIMEGDSGSGKTTLSFIISALLNCENPRSVDDHREPCGECASCRDIFEERFQRDVSFFDGSNMGKEDVVELEKLASSVPFRDRNRIIIVDEAQELSKKSFGATLKLLEKPRRNTYFIFCTMDRRAIDKPIKDRCQTYRFWPVPPKRIAEHLYAVLKAHPDIDTEQLPEEFVTEGIFLLAQYSAGSVRAALQNLERCVYGSFFDTATIQSELGFLSEDALSTLITKLLSGDPSFFTSLKTHEDTIEDFYHKSWAALLEARLVQDGALSRESLPAWKFRYHEQYLAYPRAIDRVLGIYETIFEHSRYLKTDYFLTKLWRGMFEIPKPSPVSHPDQTNSYTENPPVRRRRRKE